MIPQPEHPLATPQSNIDLRTGGAPQRCREFLPATGAAAIYLKNSGVTSGPQDAMAAAPIGRWVDS
jgi:hypothetical protein